MPKLNRRSHSLISALYSQDDWADPNGRENLSELRRDLTASGARLDELDRFVAGALQRADDAWLKLPASARAPHEPRGLPDWVARARAKRRHFESRLRELTQGFRDNREFVQAILGGQLGLGIQRHAQVFFRNQDWRVVSERDLVSLLEDFELLERLEEEEDRD